MKKFKIILSLIILFILIAPTVAEASCVWRAETTYQGGGGTTGGCYSIEEQPGINAVETCTDGQPGVSSTGASNTSYVCCCSKTEQGTQITAPKFTIPELQIKIPGCVANSETGGFECEVPWLGEYIVAIYNYSLSIAGILATIILMAGGVLWLVSGGDASRITQAKELILGSITGLIILASSYVLLIQVNPDLVKFKSIKLNPITKESLPDVDVTNLGLTGDNPYQAGCTAARGGSLDTCRGYGSTQPEGLVTVEGKLVNSQVAIQYQKAMDCVTKKNKNQKIFAIRGSFRSAESQIKIKEQKEKEGRGNEAATPCCSNHGSAKALDLYRLDGEKMTWDYNDSSGLTACMNQNGLYAKLKGSPDEPWHWSPTGK